MTEEGMIKIVAEKPPEWIMDGCMSQFRVDVNHTLWTYGDIIFNPGGWEIPDHLIAHEATHMRQQAEHPGGKDGWWKEYLITPEFRAEQEAMAYGVQYAHFSHEVKDRNQRARFLSELASKLSGPLYQAAVSRADAQKGIREIAAAFM